MLNLTRFVNRVTTSVIGLTDREWLRKNSEQQQASRAGDM